MEFLALTLNVENWQLIIAIAIMIGTLFGQPYLVREMNKKNLDKKADKNQITIIEEKVEKKADKDYVIEKFDILNQDLKTHIINNNDQFKTLDQKVTKILTLMIEKK